MVVDAGDAAPVLAYLEREGLELTAILCTHHHLDHVGGNTALLERFRVPVFGPANESIPGRTRALAEGDRITVPGIGVELAVLDIHRDHVLRAEAPFEDQLGHRVLDAPLDLALQRPRAEHGVEAGLGQLGQRTR